MCSNHHMHKVVTVFLIDGLDKEELPRGECVEINEGPVMLPKKKSEG